MGFTIYQVYVQVYLYMLHLKKGKCTVYGCVEYMIMTCNFIINGSGQITSWCIHIPNQQTRANFTINR